MNESELDQLLLQHVSQPSYRPVKPRVIAKQLALPEELHRVLKKSIKRLIKQGRIVYGKNHLVQGISSRQPNEIVGQFRRNAAGYGFVRPAGTRLAAGRSEDIFVPPQKTRDAASGDQVLIRIDKRRSPEGGSRVIGEVVRVLNRSTHQFVGTYFEQAGMGFVRIDGTEFKQPVYVGDPGAKNARANDKVVIEMVRFPSNVRNGEGVITHVLGKRGEPRVDTQTIIYEYDLPQAFPEAALDDARQQAQAFDESITEGRADLTGLTVITIDPTDARDFDDAISLERLERGHWRLGVHIADVSHFVKPGSALDDEARHRGTSVYLPDLVIPMLPEIISNNLASLQPDRIRYTQSVFIEFTDTGARVATEFRSAAICSDRRFTYDEVDDYLKDPEQWRHQLSPDVSRLLRDMHELAMILRRRRLERGAIELHLPEIKLNLDEAGNVHSAKTVVQTESHQIIEEFMLAANEAVAERLSDDEILFMRRIHESPDPKKLEHLTQFVRAVGIECESLESRFEIKRVLAAVSGQADEAAVNFAVLRSMQKAAYSPVEEGHYALASDHYCHFTSPIRRYPDLTIHRLIDAIVRGQPVTSDFSALLALSDQCSDRERRAENAERELIKLKLLSFLAGQIGHEMDAVITGVEEFGLFAQGIKLPAEGLIHVKSLADDRYFFDSTTHTLTGHREGNSFRIGDHVRVAIARVDVDRRELDFRLVGFTKQKPPRAPPRPPGRKPTKHIRFKRKGR
jgi:ribonuclease R